MTQTAHTPIDNLVDLISYAPERLKKGYSYGPDMLTSKITCYQDAKRLLQQAIKAIDANIALCVTKGSKRQSHGEDINMTPQELYGLCLQLGPGGQTKLSRLLGVTDRTVRYWLAGKRTIRPLVAERIRHVLEQAKSS